MLRATLAVVANLFPLLLSATAMMGEREVKEEAINRTPLPLLFYGRLVDDGGEPIPNAYVQFWQTDTSGVYDHPRFDVGFDAAADSTELDPSFQYFGTATTDAGGAFFFRTYRPGIYAARPITHIHYKVWHGEGPELLLTSQFYFKDEGLTFSPLLQLELSDVMDDDDGSAVVATRTNKTIAVNMGGGGSEPLTPRQVEGPYYPVVDFFGYDNDLTNARVNISITADDALSGTQSMTMAVGVTTSASREPGDGSGSTEKVEIGTSKPDTSANSASSTSSAAATGVVTRKFDEMRGGGVGMVISALAFMIHWL